MERERPRCIVYFWTWYCQSIPTKAWSWLGVSRTSSSGGWIRILCKAAARYTLFSAQLLRWIWQRWCHDERRWNAHVLFPNPETGGEEVKIRLPWCCQRRIRSRRTAKRSTKGKEEEHGMIVPHRTLKDYIDVYDLVWGKCSYSYFDVTFVLRIFPSLFSSSFSTIALPSVTPLIFLFFFFFLLSSY